MDINASLSPPSSYKIISGIFSWLGGGEKGGGVFEEAILQEGPTGTLGQVWLYLKASML